MQNILKNLESNHLTYPPMSTKYSLQEHTISAIKTFITLFMWAFLLGAQGLTTFDLETLKTLAIISFVTALRGVMNEIAPSKK